jgi:hypothetical protein
MANRYPEAALIAARQGISPGVTPALLWERALEQLYPTSPSARRKGAPRGAFLGLCEEGLVKGITTGSYGATRDNKGYAVRAAHLLLAGTQSWNVGQLWEAAKDGSDKPHNGQMDIVLALWRNGLLVTGS